MQDLAQVDARKMKAIHLLQSFIWHSITCYNCKFLDSKLVDLMRIMEAETLLHPALELQQGNTLNAST